MARKEARPTEYKSFPFKVTSLDIEGRTLEGYASVFGNLDSVGDIVHRGAFRKTLEQRGDKVKFLWQHDPKEPLGRPLELSEDDKGLFVKAIVSKTRRGLDTLELLRDGAIGELSIGYDPIEGGTDYSKGKDGEQVRNLKELKLYEFSLVTFAANEEAQVTALKEDPSPSEEKPAPDVTENTIRIRVRDPGDFQDDSFRTIPIGGDSGIQAVVGKLKDETAMTVQSYIFDKDKFSVEQAQSWVDEHKKDAVPELDEKQDEGPYRCECLDSDCGYVMESEEHCRDVKCPECGGEMRRAERPGPGKEEEGPEEISAAWTTAYVNDLPDSAFLYVAPGGEKDEEGKTEPRNLRFFPYKDAEGSIDLPHLRNAIARIPQSNAPGLDNAKKNALQERARRMLEEEQEKAVESVVETKRTPEEVVLASVILQNVMTKLEADSWERQAAELAVGKLRALYGEGKDEDAVAEMERKAGRILAARNARRIAAALTSLIEVLEDAGVDIPGYGKEPEPPKSPKEEGKNLRLELDVLGAELDLLELE